MDIATLECTRCETIQPIESFSIRKRTRKGRSSTCKTCVNKYNAEYRKKKQAEQDGWVVYYLPEEHYVGVTSSYWKRVSSHKHLGKLVDDAEVVAKFDNPFDALILEAELHRRGYLGFQYNTVL